MIKNILIVIFFLVAGTGFSQTTVTLQDQCNCEVLSGTVVTAAGMTTPSGADTGDIYVNTNTGTIYFWDGNSWELTSSDDQQLQAFSFNAGTNVLSLRIENGNTVTVNLAALANTGTDDQTASEVVYNNTASGLAANNVQAAIDEINAAAGTVALVDNGDGTYDFTDAGGTTTTISDTSISTLVDNLDGTYTYTDEAGNPSTIDTRAASNPYDNTTSGLAANNVQAAIDEINAAAGTVALVDNGDGTYEFTDAGGTTTTISDTSISTLVDNLDGTYTYTDEAGNPSTIDTRAASNPYDNTTSGLAANNVQAAIDEINAAAGTVALVDNGDGTYEFTDAGGTTTTISDTSISTLVDNLDGTYTYTDEAGNPSTIDTRAASNPYDNTTSGLAANNVQAAIDEINAAAGTVALVDNGDGTYDFTDAGGTTTTISDTSISTLVDNLDGTYTYTDEAGNPSTIDTRAASNPYDNTTSGLAANNVQAAIDEINAAAGTVALVDNGDGTYDFTDAGGTTTTISDTSISTLVDNLDGTYTYTDEAGNPSTIDTRAASNPYDNTTSGLAANNVQAAIDEINAAAGTVSLVDNGDGTYDFTDAGGTTTTISDTSISTLVDNLDGTYTYTDEAGNPSTIDTRAASNPYDNTTSGLAANNVQAAIDEINAAAGTVALVDNGDGTYDFTDAGGTTTTISDTSISTLVDNLDGTYTYTDEAGNPSTIDTRAASNPYDNTTSGLAANNVQAAIDEINAAAGTVALVDNGDGTYDFTDAGGTTTTISDTSISTLVDNLDGTYTYTDEAGNPSTIDTRAASNPYDNTTSGLAANNVQDAIDELNTGSTDDQNISGSLLSGTDLTIGIENGTSETIDLSSLAETVVAGTGALTVSDDGNGNYTVNSTDPDEDITNELTLIGTGAPAIIPSNSGVTYVDDAAGQLYVYDGAAWQQVGGSASPDLDPDPANELNSGFVVNGANLEITDNGGTLAVPLASIGTDDQTLSTTGAAGNISIEDGNTVNLNVDDADADPTNEYNTAFAVNGANLEITDNGGTLAVPVASLGTDDQNISGSGLSGTDLTIGIENGTSETVDLSSLVGTDDQALTTTGAAGNISIEDGNTLNLNVDDADADPTNEYNTAFAVNGANLEITDNGSTLSVPVSSLGTDDQNIENLGLAGTVLTVGIEDGVSQTVDLSTINTDQQDLSSAVVTPNESVEIQITNGTNTTIDIRDADADLTNELTLIGAGAPAVIPSNSGVTYVDSVAGQLYIWDGTTWNAVGGNATPDLDGDPTNEYNTAFAVNGANLEITDNGSTLSVPVASLGTDDQNLTLVANTLGIEDGNSVDLSGYLDNTDDQNISGSGLSGTDLTIGIENGSSQVVDLSSLVGTDDQALSTTGAAGNITIEDGNTLNLNVDDADADPTNEYNTAFAVNGANLEITDNGSTLSVPVASLGTDDQNLSLVANTLGIEDGNSVDLSGYLDNTDDQNISGSGLSGTDLTIGIENGTSETIDLSSLVGTDDQNLTGATLSGANILQIDIENGASTTVDLSSLDDSGTDDQNLTLVANTLGIEDGNSVDLSPYLDNTDDQALSTTGAAGNITIEDGNTLNLNVDDADAVIGNEVTDATDATLIRSGAGTAVSPYTLDVAPDGITNAEIADQAVQLENLADGTSDGQVIQWDGTTSSWTLVDLGSVTVTENDGVIGNEVTNATDGTLVRSGSGTTVSPFTLDVAADGITNAEIADQAVQLENIADGTSPDQIMQWNGTNWVLVDGGALSTDDQNLSLVANTLGIEDGNSVDLSPYLDNTDDQNLTGATLSGANILQIDIENGASTTVDLSSLDDSGTDDQNLSLVANTLGIEDGNSVDLSGYLDNTDDQNISGSGLSGTDLTIGIENGSSQVVDLSSLVGTDDQALSTTGAAGNITIEDGNTLNLNVDDADADPTNEYNTAFAVNGANLEITDNGSTLSVPVASLGTDDQNLSLVANTLGIEDGNSVDLSGYLDNTDDQNISGSGLSGTDLTIGIENGTSETIDLSSLVGTDDQNLTGATLSGANILQIDIENGASTTVDLSSLDDSGTDDQALSTTGAAGNITIEDGNTLNLNVDDADAVIGNEVTDATDATLIRSGAGTAVSPYTLDVAPDGITNAEIADQAVQLENLADGTSDGQVIQWDGTTSSWTLVDLGSVTVTENDGVIGNEVTNATDGTLVRSGSGTTVSPFTLDVAADGITNAEIADQAVQLENIADGTSPDQIMQWNGTNWVLVDGGALSTDDQNLSLVANTLGIEDGNSVDLSPYLDNTDDQNISGSGLSGTDLTIGIENGTSETIDLSSLVGTDDQALSTTGAAGNISIEDGNTLNLNVDDADADPTNEYNTAFAVNGANLEITDNGSTLSVPVASLGTDDQNLSLVANTLGIEDGNSVDLSPYLDNTDDQNLTGATLSGANILQIDIENGASTTVDLSSLDDSGTDDQNLSLVANTWASRTGTVWT